MVVPDRHAVLGTPLTPPFPEGFEHVVFGMGCFWGAERKFWQAAGRVHDRRRLRRRLHAEPDLRGGVQRPHRPHRGGARRVRPRAGRRTRRCCKVFWENHDPTQGMRQGNDVGTQYRSAIYSTTDAAARRGRGLARRVPGALCGRRPRRDHDRDRAGAGAFYYAEAVPPAVPRRRTRTATAASAAPGVSLPDRAGHDLRVARTCVPPVRAGTSGGVSRAYARTKPPAAVGNRAATEPAPVHDLLGLQATAGNAAVARMIQRQASPAAQLIEKHTWGPNLNEEALGEEIVDGLPGNAGLAFDVFDTLPWTDRDDVAVAICEAADDDAIKRIAVDPAARP